MSRIGTYFIYYDNFTEFPEWNGNKGASLE